MVRRTKKARISGMLSDRIDDLSLKFGIPKTLAGELIATPSTEHFFMESKGRSKDIELRFFTMRTIKTKRRRK